MLKGLINIKCTTLNLIQAGSTIRFKETEGSGSECSFILVPA